MKSLDWLPSFAVQSPQPSTGPLCAWMVGSFPHAFSDDAQPKMNRRKFISASTAAAIGFGASSILTGDAQEKESMDTSTQSFWPDKARLVISISMQFETGAQPDRGAG